MQTGHSVAVQPPAVVIYSAVTVGQEHFMSQG